MATTIMASRDHPVQGFRASLGGTVGAPTRLLDAHGPRDLEAALAEAVAVGALHRVGRDGKPARPADT